MDINVIELKAKLERGDDFLLIDVREDYEHYDFNLGGRLIPLGKFMGTLNELEEYREKEIVIYCRSGVRSASAQSFLKSLGFKNVRNLIGGVIAWYGNFGLQPAKELRKAV